MYTHTRTRILRRSRRQSQVLSIKNHTQVSLPSMDRFVNERKKTFMPLPPNLMPSERDWVLKMIHDTITHQKTGNQRSVAAAVTAEMLIPVTYIVILSHLDVNSFIFSFTRYRTKPERDTSSSCVPSSQKYFSIFNRDRCRRGIIERTIKGNRACYKPHLISYRQHRKFSHTNKRKYTQ